MVSLQWPALREAVQFASHPVRHRGTAFQMDVPGIA